MYIFPFIRRNDFQKLGKDLTVAKGRDMEKCNKIVEHLKESYCKYGEVNFYLYSVTTYTY